MALGMQSSRRFPSILAAVLVLCLMSALAAQDTDETSETSSLIHSARLVKDRGAQGKFERAELAAERGELVEAVGLARELMETDAGTWVLVRPVGKTDPGQATPHELWRSAPQAARDLLGRLGPAGREQFRTQQEALARAALRVATQSGRPEAMREVAVRFQPLKEGLAALRFLAAQSLDRGQAHCAASAFGQILRHPLANDAQRNSAQRGMRAALSALGQRQTDGERQTGTSTNRVRPLQKTLPEIAALVPFRGHPIWEIPVAVGDGTANAMADALHEHTLQSIPRVLRARPESAGQSVLVRVAGQIQRIDPRTGDIQWELSASTSATSAGTRINNNLSMQSLMARNLAKELQIDTIATQVRLNFQAGTEQGSFTYVESTPQTTLPHLRQGAAIRVRAVGPFGSRVVVPTKNRIALSDLKSGQTNWVYSGVDFLAKEDGSNPPGEAQIYFLGPPTRIDDLHCGMVQVGQSIRLYALNADGQLVWQSTLCETARELQQNVDWRFQACHVVPAGGVLLCPTSTGILFGFDLATRTPLWTRRYLRDDIIDMSEKQIRRQGPSVTRHWWRCWREMNATPLTVNGEPHIVLASPDRRGVSLLNALTGEEAWYRPVDDPLELITVTEKHAVFSEPGRLTALFLQTGETAWQTHVPEIIGRGYVTHGPASGSADAAQDSFYVCPSQDRRLNAVRLRDGFLFRTTLADSSPAGNLLRTGDIVIEQTPEKMTAWRMLSKYLSPDAESRFPSSTLAEAEATAGLFQAAADRWQALLDSGGDPVSTASSRRNIEQQFWKMLVVWLETDSGARSRVEPLLRSLASTSSVRRQIELSHSLGRSLAAAGESTAALDRFLQTLLLNPGGDEPVYSPGQPLRMVRHDRLLQGELVDLMMSEEDSDEAVSELRARFAGHLQQARRSPDPFAAQRLGLLLSAHPWAATLQLDEKSEVGRTFLQRQISLLRLSESPDTAVAARSLERLAELYGSRNHEIDAALSTLRLIDRLADQPRPQARDVLTRPDGIPDRTSLIGKLEQSDWDGLQGKAEIESVATPASTYVRIPVECDAGSLFDRLEVAVTIRTQRNKRTIRFCGDGEAGAWKLELPVPPTAASRAFMMPRGWGLGHLLILEIGGELLAVSPYARNGEPRPSLIWSRDIVEGNHLASPQIRQRIPGFQPAAMNFLDPFDRPLSVTGPVRSGYLCVQTRGRLLCLDPVTGQQLWERYRLPFDAVVAGDAECVFLIDRDRGRVEVLRAVDGASLGQHSLPRFASSSGPGNTPGAPQPHPTFLCAESSVLLIRHGDEVDSPAEVIDLKSGLTAWKLPRGTRHLFRADRGTIGCLSETGDLVLRNLVTGHEISRMTPELPESIDAIECVRDRQRWFIGIHSMKNAKVPAARYSTVAPLNGTLVAISRLDGRLLWQRHVRDSQLPLIQHGTIPVLVFAWTEQSTRPAGNRIVETIYHLIDKRTGETILNDRAVGSHATFLINPDPARRRVEIQSNRRTYRVDFTEAP